MVSSQTIVSIWYTFVHGTILTLICSCCTPNELVLSNLPCIKLLELHPHKSIPRGASTLSYRGSEIQSTYGIICTDSCPIVQDSGIFGSKVFPYRFKKNHPRRNTFPYMFDVWHGVQFSNFCFCHVFCLICSQLDTIYYWTQHFMKNTPF